MKPFTSKSQTFGLGQTILADKFWDIWGIFSQLISTQLGTVSPLSMFSINQPLFFTNPTYLFGIGICIWAAKNLGFSHRVYVVHDFTHTISEWNSEF